MKSIVICTGLDQHGLNTLKTLPSKIDLQGVQIHLIHVFEIRFASPEFVPVIYPVPDQYPAIEKDVLQTLTGLAKDLKLPENMVVKKCIFSQSRDEVLKDYLNEVKAELVVVATRGKHGIEGFFASSLADFLCKFSPCDVLVMRPSA
ncbi:MAG: universal stress protein [Bacteriovorax sp.]|nr:universal stress protein [Bacteriovorax sp.]